MTQATHYNIDLAERAERNPGIRIFTGAISAAFEEGVLVKDEYMGDTIRTQTLAVPMGNIATFGPLLLERPETSIVHGMHPDAKAEDIRQVDFSFIGNVYVEKDSGKLHVGNLGILAKGIVGYRGRNSDFTVRHALFPGARGDTDLSFYARHGSQLWVVATALDLGVNELPKVPKARIDWSTGRARIGWEEADL